MAVVYVNNQPVEIGDEKLNAIQAAQKAGVFVPHYCWHPALSVVASCRMCLVEVGDRKPDGSVQMQPRVVPGCQTPVKDGSVVVTDSPKAKAAQAGTLEGLLLNHPLDCPVCDKAGECMLQDFSYNYGRSQSRMIDEKNTPPNKPHIGPQITLFADRCIMCSRCVRFTREISGTAELQVINRGDHSEIDIFPGEPVDNKLAGNVVDLCPVGALCSKDFLYKHRVWNLKTVESVCPDCSTGCSINLDGNKGIAYRLRPRYNPQAQGHFMCDEGRFGYHYINSPERLLGPKQRVDGKLVPVAWAEVIPAIRKEFRETAASDGAGVVGVFSPFMTCEEAYLLASFLKGLSGQVRLVMGPVPVVGEDDTFPKTRRGDPAPDVKFTIRAEKCPNRRGVEEVLRHFQGGVTPFNDFLRWANEGNVKAAFLAAGYPPRGQGWISEEQAQAVGKIGLVVAQEIFLSPAGGHAKYVLPAASFAEKEGTFVNHGGLAQAIHRGVNPAEDGRVDGQVFADLLERRGLFHAASLRKELADTMRAFAKLGGGDPGEFGVKL